MKLINYLNTSIRSFFRIGEVRREICAIASVCASTEVITENSDSVTFTGSGTEDDPLTAEATGGGGGSYAFSNGLREDSGEVKLGLGLTPPYTNGLLTEPTFLLFGNVAGGDTWGLSLNNDGQRSVQFQSGEASTGKASNVLATIDQLSITKQNGAEGSSITFNANNDIEVNSSALTFKGLSYSADYSANYTDRSLVDKGYVDNHIPTTPNFIVTTNDEQDLIPGGYYTNNTTQNGIWNLPIVAGSEGKRIGVINQNSGTVTVNGDIYYNGAPVSTLEVMQGETYILYDNGLRWTVIA